MAETVLHVRMLGEFSVSCGSITVNGGASRSYKTWLMLAYLICHRNRWVPHGELIQLLDGSERNTNPNGAIRATLLRARRALEPLSNAVGRELVVSRGGAFRWSPELPTELDAEQFEDLCKAAETDENARLDTLRKALALAHGPFLHRYSGEAWAGAISTYYDDLYIDAVENILPLLNGEENAREAVTLCRAALQRDPYRESVCRYLMRGLVALGDYDGAEAAYFELRDRLLDDLSVEPDEETREVYRAVATRLGDRYVTEGMIRDQLREKEMPTGAMICDYAMFKLFYRAEARAADRRGDAIHVGMLSITDRNGKQLSDRALERAMIQLEEGLRSTLRIGDVITRCSASQYLVLLVQANYENSLTVCRRVIRAFERENPRSPARVNVAVIPLEPLLDVR